MSLAAQSTDLRSLDSIVFETYKRRNQFLLHIFKRPEEYLLQPRFLTLATLEVFVCGGRCDWSALSRIDSVDLDQVAL